MLSLTRRALEDFDNQHDFERFAADVLNALAYTPVEPMAPGGGADVFTATDTTDSVTVTQTATVTFTDGSGAGTMTVSPTSATAGSTGNSLTFQFRTSATSGTYGSSSYATVVVPTGWTAPQTSSGRPL